MICSLTDTINGLTYTGLPNSRYMQSGVLLRFTNIFIYIFIYILYLLFINSSINTNLSNRKNKCGSFFLLLENVEELKKVGIKITWIIFCTKRVDAVTSAVCGAIVVTYSHLKKLKKLSFFL